MEIKNAFQSPLAVIRKKHPSRNRICISPHLQILSILDPLSVLVHTKFCRSVSTDGRARSQHISVLHLMTFDSTQPNMDKVKFASDCSLRQKS